MTTSLDQSASRQQIGHALPGWFQWAQRHIFPSVFIGGEAFLYGVLMASGWVPDIQDPSTWGVYGLIGVIVFFTVGVAIAGIALCCSVKAASCLQRKSWGFGLVNLAGAMMFVGAEIWGSLAERSASRWTTPADTLALAHFGHARAPITPTDLVVSVLLPLGVLFYGFAWEPRQSPAAETDVEERQHRQQAELADARHKAELRAVKSAGRCQQFQALIGTVNPLAQAEASEVAEGGFSGDNGSVLAGEDAQDSPDECPQEMTSSGLALVGEIVPAKSAPRRRSQTRAAKGTMSASEYRAHAQDVYDVEVSEADAVATVKTTPGCRQEAARGKPWVAPRTTLIARAKALYGASATDQVKGA